MILMVATEVVAGLDVDGIGTTGVREGGWEMACC